MKRMEIREEERKRRTRRKGELAERKNEKAMEKKRNTRESNGKTQVAMDDT